MKSIRGEIGWARAAPIHAHTPRPRVPALIRVNSKSEAGLTYTRLTGMELCHCSFPVASAASRASLMRFSTWRQSGETNDSGYAEEKLLFAQEWKRTRAVFRA